MDGILVINKEKGYTSRDVVNIISNTLHIKKVGHTGTLDPSATGVLVVCIGSATKLVDYITSYDKEYLVEATLGFETDTLDLEGIVINEKETEVNKEDIIKTLNSFKGDYFQEVPAYSSVKINGKKLYEYARAGENVVLPKRQVFVNSIKLIGEIKQEAKTTVFNFKVNVSKGTYIRSLVKDIATSLNTYGTMSDLTRTKQGEFSIEDSISISEFKAGTFKLMSIKEIFKDVKQIKTSEPLILHTNVIENVYDESKILFLDENEEPIALYETYKNTYLKPTKVFKKS